MFRLDLSCASAFALSPNCLLLNGHFRLEFFRLDSWEDDSRRRRRLVPNPFGSRHPEARLRAHRGSATVAPLGRDEVQQKQIKGAADAVSGGGREAEKSINCSDGLLESEKASSVSLPRDLDAVLKSTGAVRQIAAGQLVQPSGEERQGDNQGCTPLETASHEGTDVAGDVDRGDRPEEAELQQVEQSASTSLHRNSENAHDHDNPSVDANNEADRMCNGSDNMTMEDGETSEHKSATPEEGEKMSGKMRKEVDEPKAEVDDYSSTPETNSIAGMFPLQHFNFQYARLCASSESESRQIEICFDVGSSLVSCAKVFMMISGSIPLTRYISSHHHEYNDRRRRTSYLLKRLPVARPSLRNEVRT
ncbi:unnamed protein product [Protopolystoma xenopodis]|uniref:DUF1088 domain-containing protein n=1 Tax=Protopolystoma xenopodis TaxID=117903 RepID=A0A448X2U8_9PLAT|nr:unnamed protein product [Protopolystoma xenopodis]